MPSSRPHPRFMPLAGAFTLASALTLASSGSLVAQDPSPVESDTSLTVYSGRSESLVAPLLERFAQDTGIDVQVRYGDSAELAALLLEEGERSPADVFFAQDAGALGAVSEAGSLAALDQGVLDRVDLAFRDPGGTWVGVSGRARTAAYDTTDPDLVMPGSILDFTDPAWSGRLGWVPSNASFQAFVTALRVLQGEEVARSWLEGILANAPVVYENNASAVQGVAAGEVDVAFVNHYYLMRLLSEFGDDYPVANHFFAGGDPGSLVNVAGVGTLATSDQPEAAGILVDFLLAEDAQRYFSETTYEYPLIEGIPADPRLPDLASLEGPDIDLSQLADLQGTVELLRAVGVID
ncbi:iron ABC transporter substrate-binding protein [soil metagenome]